MEEQDVLLGGDIILQVDEIKIVGMESVLHIFDYLDSKGEDAHTFSFRVLRGGKIIEFNWITSGF